MSDDEPITVQKYAAYVPFSIEASDAPMGYDPAMARTIPWRTRLRWRWQSWRERAGRKIGGWIAGIDLREDDW